jgi:hypothetical protein
MRGRLITCAYVDNPTLTTMNEIVTEHLVALLLRASAAVAKDDWLEIASATGTVLV